MIEGKAQRALRLVNMGISDNFCKMWLDFVITNLEWNNRERARVKDRVGQRYREYIGTSAPSDRRDELREEFDKEKEKERPDVPYLMPHEFLFLLCNTHNVLDLIQRAHKPDLSSKYGEIYQWEISGGRPMSVMREQG